MKKLILHIIIVSVSLFGFTQNPDRSYKSHAFEKGKLTINTNDGQYRFNIYSRSVLETSFIPNGEDYNQNSHAVVTQRPSLKKINYREKDNNIFYGSNGIAVTITKSPFKISYTYKELPLISEKRGYYKSAHEPMDMVSGNIVYDTTEKIEFNLTPNEVLYGGGARALGMNRRGKRLPLYNRAHYGYETHSELMNYTLPIVLSSNKYMVHFDNAPIGYLDLDSKNNNTLTYETISGRKTYQVIAGDSWKNIINHYTRLTGKQPMLPRWALGNFSSRFGYHSQQETEATIDKFIEEKIPVDAIILDLYWFGKDIKGTMGNLEVFRDSFPDFEGMIKRLNDKGVKTITITEPFILTTSNRWQEAVNKNVLAKDSIGNDAKYDFYFGNTGIVDIYKPKGEQWFWNIYKDIANKGVAGVWGDLGEPEVLPAWVNFSAGTADEVHNIYGHDWARLVYEGYQRDFPKTRPFILMRAGYSGSQRYGMIPWSGDVNRTWGGLQSQPEIALQMGMQGLAYMHSDLGGFAGANLDDELYVRWLQYGVFNPIFRPHAQEDVASEPIFRSDRAKTFAKKAIELRYKLLPYNYNLVYKNHIYGTPLMRPLFFEEADNSQLFDYSKTYLWGNDILVSPILEAGKTKQEVYFPKTSNWFNAFTEEKIEGGQTKTIPLRESYIPTFIRAGAFLPMTNVGMNTKNYEFNDFELHYYHDESVNKSKRSFYNDDGITKEASEYELLSFSSKSSKRNLCFEFEKAAGTIADTKQFQLSIHNIKNAPKRVKVNGKKVDILYDQKHHVLSIPLTWNTSEALKIKLKL